MHKNVELRKVNTGTLCNIINILEKNDDWKKVMALVPRNPRSEYFEPKYTNEHIKQIEDHANLTNRQCAEILLEEWGTSGRIRPTLATLKDVIERAEIYRAADELANMLKEDLPQRPNDGPAARIMCNVTDLLDQTTEHIPTGSTRQIDDEKPVRSFGNKTTVAVESDSNDFTAPNIPRFSAMLETDQSLYDHNNGISGDPTYQKSYPEINVSASGIDSAILNNAELENFAYRELEHITKRFSEKLIYIPDPVQGKLAGKIGSGGFGDVFVGYHQRHGHLAVKRAQSHSKFADIGVKVFNAEVKFLSQLRHKNIVPIIGFSRDGPALCIVCEYIDGGSLEQKLEARILTERQRINIMIGTAEGLRYLHGYERTSPTSEVDPSSLSKNNFVHGDVKTANIMLTRDCVPKLCDFGLAKQFEKTFITIAPMGTSAYMAPEAFTGTITQSGDMYSYGIVLLQLLTGSKPVIPHDGETINIKDYIEESYNGEITTLLDPFIDKWSKGKEIYAIAKNCLLRDRKARPTSQAVCELLYKISEEAEKEALNSDFKAPSPYQLLDVSTPSQT